MLQEKNVIVTGGAQGIGKATALHLLQLGAQVVIADVDAEAGKAAEDELRKHGNVLFIETDTADEASVENMTALAISTFGSLYALINNAAIAAPEATKPEDLQLHEWERYLKINLTGYFLCARQCIPHLRKSKGAIVNISSTRAYMSEKNTLPYSATKGGVLALTHSLAISLGPEIRVNSISPGWIAVDDWKKPGDRKRPELSEQDHMQHPAGRVGEPGDIARAVVFLIDPQNSFITGQDFIIDGGMTRKMIYV